jgi:hypothetical protein
VPIENFGMNECLDIRNVVSHVARIFLPTIMEVIIHKHWPTSVEPQETHVSAMMTNRVTIEKEKRHAENA